MAPITTGASPPSMDSMIAEAVEGGSPCAKDVKGDQTRDGAGIVARGMGEGIGALCVQLHAWCLKVGRG